METSMQKTQDHVFKWFTTENENILFTEQQDLPRRQIKTSSGMEFMIAKVCAVMPVFLLDELLFLKATNFQFSTKGNK